MFGQARDEQPSLGMAQAKPRALTGPELMLRNFGLGPVLDAAKELVENGAVQKIIAFADNLPKLMQQMGEINERLARLERAAGTLPNDNGGVQGGGTEPGSGSGDPGGAPGGPDVELSEQSGAD